VTPHEKLGTRVEHGAASSGQQTREEEDTATTVAEEIWDTQQTRDVAMVLEEANDFLISSRLLPCFLVSSIAHCFQQTCRTMSPSRELTILAREQVNVAHSG